MQTQAQATSAKAPSDYIDLHTNGIGIARRAREVKPKKGEPFLAVSISAMFGDKRNNQVEYVPYDVKAVTEQASDALNQFTAEINDDTKQVMVRFQIGDAYINTFTKTNGEQGLSMKGRLLRVTHVWVKAKNEADNGYKEVYNLPKLLEAAAQAEAAAAPDKTGTAG